MATTDPPHLRWQLDEHFRGQTLRVAFQLPGVASSSVDDVTFAIEQEGQVNPVRVAVSLKPGGVAKGESGVQLIPDPTALVPPLPAGVTTYEAVIDSVAFNLPSSWYRAEAWIDWTYGNTPVSAGRLHLREPALT